jgi:citrate synthase
MSTNKLVWATQLQSIGLQGMDGEEGILRHRGYSIEDLAENCTFLEVAYLLIKGNLPNVEEIGDDFFRFNESLIELNTPLLKTVGARFLYDNEFDASVFIRIGQSLCDQHQIYKEDDENEIFETKKRELLDQIEYLTLSNKKLSDKIKIKENELHDLNNTFTILDFFTNKQKIAKLKKEVEEENKLYNDTFDKITNMYEEIDQIGQKFK